MKAQAFLNLSSYKYLLNESSEPNKKKYIYIYTTNSIFNLLSTFLNKLSSFQLLKAQSKMEFISNTGTSKNLTTGRMPRVSDCF